MKNSQQILGLPVLSIEEGKQIGIVKHLVLDPESGKVSYILIEDDAWYLGGKTIPFEAVQGIGEFGLTIANISSLTAIADCREAIKLLEINLRLSGTKVLSRKGRLLGTVSEYVINEDNAQIVGCQLMPLNSEEPAGIIPRKCILTFGHDFLVVEETTGNMLVADLQELENVVEEHPSIKEEDTVDSNATSTGAKTAAAPLSATAPDTAPKTAEAEEKPADTLKHFEEQQRKYLLGKKVTMKIVADDGEVIAEEGATITNEIIERARAADRYIQLTLNIRD